MIGHLVDLLVLVGAAVMAVLAYRLGASQWAQKPPRTAVGEKVKADTLEAVERHQEAVTAALESEDPAQALADLGNERRS
jgi:hypothetical protein